MVSVIVAVYESEKYLNKCLNSLVNQTYNKIEILLVLGESVDRSRDICFLYAQNDRRVRVIEQLGKGAGAARNQGVEEAQGEYICFVDSDDWVDERYVEKLLNSMTENDADFVECDYFWGTNGNDRIGGNSPYYKVDYRLIALLGAPACWKFMYKKNYWIRKKMAFSNTVAEDLYLFLCAYRMSRKSTVLPEPLYYYRIRQGSFTETGKTNINQYLNLYSMIADLIDVYKSNGIWNKYKEDLYRTLSIHVAIRYRAICSILEINTQIKLRNTGYDFIKRKFGKEINCFNRRVVAFGSYNLGRISNPFSVEDIRKIRFGFSSIISAMSRTIPKIHVENNNLYRLRMIEKDINRSFVNEIKNNTPDLLLIDLLEERNDIIKYRDGYITSSEIFKDSVVSNKEYKVLSRTSDECDDLWMSACDVFADLINSIVEKCQVIIVEIFLSEYIGTIYEKIRNTNKTIRDINKKLRKYYDYLEKRCPRAHIIHLDEIPDRYVYTEKGFEHGEMPEYYNYFFYDYISNMIMDVIDLR